MDLSPGFTEPLLRCLASKPMILVKLLTYFLVRGETRRRNKSSILQDSQRGQLKGEEADIEEGNTEAYLSLNMFGWLI